MIRYICKKDKLQTVSSICPVCGERTELEGSRIFYCEECHVPLFQPECECCGKKGKYLTTDIRPVFSQERLLIELILGEPFLFENQSVWCGPQSYFVNGTKKSIRYKELTQEQIEQIRNSYETLNESERQKKQMQKEKEVQECFVKANRSRYEDMVLEAGTYIREKAQKYAYDEMFVSFSGGKDSTVVSDLVMKSLSTPGILHIFGDTTLEFPLTEEYVKRFKKEHNKTIVLSSRNKDKDFQELCRQIGPPSRVMRWCCTIFKTGAISRKIASLFRNKENILTFYGIRRNESASRSKYDRESDSPKITKQKTVSPIIDWTDFDVWLYLLTTRIDFNEAYRLGYTRVGCWCCPNNSGWSEFLAKIHMPEQYQEFRQLLIDFARSIGKKDAEVYVDTGKWKARQGGNGMEYAKNSIIEFEECALQENAFNYSLNKPISEQLYELFKPFGYLNFDMGNQRLGEVFVLSRAGRPLLKLQGRIGTNTLKVSILDFHIAGCKNMKNAEEKIKCQLTKYQMCMACLACESVCKRDAIKITENKNNEIDYRIDDAKCIRCAECVGHFIGGCYIRKVLAIKRNKEN